ncbi:tripartite multidrug resistance system outer membrane protein [Klebsiella pneumoniae]|nr:tripartite multidrug resistance system outer membrane protein [Klebsiella pneumoniae]
MRFRDVAISSSQLNDLNQQRALQQLKVTAAQTTTDSARAHYQRGLLSRYAAEEARRAVLAQQLLLLDIEAQRLSTDITLIQSPGRRLSRAVTKMPSPRGRQSDCRQSAIFSACPAALRLRGPTANCITV